MLRFVRRCLAELDVRYLPAISNMVLSVRLSWSPLHSRALMPKSEVKKDRGRNLARVSFSFVLER